MRRFLPLAKILLVAAVAAGSPLATANARVAAVPSIVSPPSLICILPNCGGRPYCRASNGCWVCCTN